MGNEASTPVDDSVRPATLKRRDLESVASYILKKNARRIVVLVRRKNTFCYYFIYFTY